MFIAKVGGDLPLPVRPVLVSLLLMLGLTACNEPQVQPLALGDAPWQSGEQSVYRVTDINGDFAGTLQFDINQGQTRLDEPGWTFRRQTSAQGDQELVAVDVAEQGYLPQNAMLVRTNAAGTERVETVYADGQVDMTLTTVQDVTTYERNQIPSDARDQRTVVMLLRTLPLEQGYAVRLNSFLPVANLLERVTVEVIRQEEVTVPAGTFDTWLVELSTPVSETRAWVGTAPPYPVVKFTESRNGGLFELESLGE